MVKHWPLYQCLEKTRQLDNGSLHKDERSHIRLPSPKRKVVVQPLNLIRFPRTPSLWIRHSYLRRILCSCSIRVFECILQTCILSATIIHNYSTPGFPISLVRSFAYSAPPASILTPNIDFLPGCLVSKTGYEASLSLHTAAEFIVVGPNSPGHRASTGTT
jgi:hypothetical protein